MMPVAILCGGLGTRLKPLTDDKPKYLVDVNGFPFGIRQIELLRKHGYTDIVLCVGHQWQQIQGAMWRFMPGHQIRHSLDNTQGTAPAIMNALPILGEAFFTLYGDAYLECDYAEIERTFRESGKAGLVTEWNGIDYGLSAFTAEGFKLYGQHCKSLNTVHALMEKAKQLVKYPMPQRFREMGSHEGLAELRQHLADLT